MGVIKYESRGRLFWQVDETLVMPDGREVWNADEQIVFPRACVETFGGDVSFTGLLLWNLEQRGVIAPGQLFD